MSNITRLSADKDKKRPSVSSKCLLNIKSIVAQNVSSNTTNKNACLHSPPSIFAPLPLMNVTQTSKESINHLNDREEMDDKKRKKSQSFPNRNVLVEYLQKSDVKKTSNKQISATNGHDRSNVENSELPQASPRETEQEGNFKPSKFHIEELQPNVPPVISKQSTSEQYSSPTLNNYEQTIIPPLPLDSSMYPFGSPSFSPHIKPLLSFPVQSSNRINEEYLAQMQHIIASTNDSNETKLIELSIHRHQSISIHRFDSESPTISTRSIDEDEDNYNDLNGPLVFVNSALNLSVDSSTPTTHSDRNVQTKSRLSERSEKDVHNHRKLMNNHIQPHQLNPRCSTSYTRLPHSLRKKPFSFNSFSQSGATNNPLIRRPFPQFESVRTPVQKSPTTKQESPSTIPSEMFDCCQTESVPLTTERRSNQRQGTSNESETRSKYFRDTSKIREIMINASKRLTAENDQMPGLPLVDTHCHFDLIFDRLRIKHNDLKKYFNDYNEFYPPGLSFELAIQVFWRTKHLTEKNWNNWYSKYLDDERVYGSCGIHPHWSSAWNETCAEDIERCLQHPKIVAIGEIGLDFGPKNSCAPHEQCRAFEAQLKLAAKWLKPIVIHSRDAYKLTFDLMKKYLEPNHKIHLHCFVGTIDDVYLFTSYFTEIKFGFTPIITRTNFLHTVIQQLEITQILSETDSPYFIPDELSKLASCAHPGMVYSVVEMVAQLRYLPVIDVACQLRENARHIYGV